MYWAIATSVEPARFWTVDPDERGVPGTRPPEGIARTPRDRVTLSPRARALGGQKLSAEEQQQVRELQARDAEVRAHEAAHQAAAGSLGGGASFSYVMGPDGRQYAVGGEVPIQLREGRTPEETIANAERVARAALAPANPSPQDLAVAGAASRMAADARARKAQEAAKAYARQRERSAGRSAGREGEGPEAQPLPIIGPQPDVGDAPGPAAAA